MEAIGKAFEFITKTKLRSFLFGMAVLTIFTMGYRTYFDLPLWG